MGKGSFDKGFQGDMKKNGSSGNVESFNKKSNLPGVQNNNTFNSSGKNKDQSSRNNSSIKNENLN